MIFGIDVSKHQGTIDWPRVSGVDFAICRASLATTPDPTFDRNLRGAKDRGLLAGAYHFLYPSAIVPAREQCNLFWSQLDRNPEGILTVLDVEKDGTAYPTYADVQAFVDRWRALTGHPLIIYTGKWYWNGSDYPIKGRDGSMFGPLWKSQYVDPVSTSIRTLFAQVEPSYWTGFGGWDEVTLLQFTSSASVSGISGRVDANAYRGTLAQLRSLAFTIPDTSEEPVGLPVDQETFVYEPGWVTVKNIEGVQAFQIADNERFGMAPGVRKRTIGRARLMGDPLGKDADFGEDRHTIRLIGKELAGLLAAQVTFEPDPTPADPTPYDQADIDAAVAATKAAARVVFG